MFGAVSSFGINLETFQGGENFSSFKIQSGAFNI